MQRESSVVSVVSQLPTDKVVPKSPYISSGVTFVTDFQYLQIIVINTLHLHSLVY